MVPRDVQPNQSAGIRRRRRRGPLLIATACLLLLVLLVATPGIIYLREYRRCATYTPTGDALFDHYARAVLAHQAPRLFTAAYKGSNPVVLAPEEVGHWVDEFGGDARYWELCYSLASELPEASLTTPNPAVGYLELARERGIAGVDTLDALFRESYRGWLAAEPAVATAETEALARDARRQRCRAVLDAHGVELEALAAEMIDADPFQCRPYYLRAWLRFNRGELAAALEDLRQGNTAPLNRQPDTFPRSVVRRTALLEDGFGNAALLGGLLMLGATGRTAGEPDWQDFGAMIRDLDPQWQRQFSAEFSRFACRYGTQDGAEWKQRTAAARWIREQAEYYLVDRGAELSNAERQALFDLVVRTAEVRLQLQRQWGSTVDFAQFKNTQTRLDRLLATVGNASPAFLAFYARTEAGRYSDRHGACARHFRLMARFDFVTLAWPDVPAR